MRQLPRARHAQDDELKQRPANNPRIRRLGLISELGFPFLEQSYPTPISQKKPSQ